MGTCGRCGGASSVHGGTDWAQGTAGARVGRGVRTLNMPSMTVTLDVSQLETSSSKVAKLRNRSRMSVIDETTQPEIGPYASRAAARSLTHIWTAIFREALVAKDDGGEGGDSAEHEPETKLEP